MTRSAASAKGRAGAGAAAGCQPTRELTKLTPSPSTDPQPMAAPTAATTAATTSWRDPQTRWRLGVAHGCYQVAVRLFLLPIVACARAPAAGTPDGAPDIAGSADAPADRLAGGVLAGSARQDGQQAQG